MATYLVIQSAGQTKSYTCKSSHSGTPYLKVSNSYLDLTTQSHTGIRLKVVSNNVAYYPVVGRQTTLTNTVTITQTTGVTGRSSRSSTSGYTGYSSRSSTSGITGRSSRSSTSGYTGYSSRQSTSGYTGYLSRSSTSGYSGKSSSDVTETTGKSVRSITNTVSNLVHTTIGNWAPAATSIGKTTKSASVKCQAFTRSTMLPSNSTTGASSTRYSMGSLNHTASAYSSDVTSSYTDGNEVSFLDDFMNYGFVQEEDLPANVERASAHVSYTLRMVYITRKSSGNKNTKTGMTEYVRKWGATYSSKTFSYITYETAYKTVLSTVASNTNWVGSTWMTKKTTQTYYRTSATTNAGLSSTTALTRQSNYLASSTAVGYLSSTTALTRSSGYYNSSTAVGNLSSTTALTRSSTYYTSSVTTNAGISSTTALTRQSNYLTSSVGIGNMSSTTALTRSSTYYTSSVTTNAGISSTTALTRETTSESTYVTTI